MTLAQWLDKNLASKSARQLLGMALAGSYTSAPSELSMLFVAYQLASAGGPQFVLGVENAAEDSRPVGGMGAIYHAMAARVTDDIHVNRPVRSITQDGTGVTVRSDDMTVRAKRVIVSVPLSIASQIIYEPMLPYDRSFLLQRVPSGAIIKSHAVYDEPFWRKDGLTGQTAAPGTAASVTIDACTHNQQPGVLAIINEGPHARALAKMSAAERRDAALSAIAERFGPKAKSPIEYVEQNWITERYSGGAMMAHTPPGVMTEFWYVVREPCNRIHWAGTETSAVMCGFVDGAVRSGERAAQEVMAREGEIITGDGQLAGAPG
jgi:monoamine oxidase